MRLFFLHKFGGIYIDLDIECRRSLDFLRHYPWVMPQARPRTAAAPRVASKLIQIEYCVAYRNVRMAPFSALPAGTGCSAPPATQKSKIVDFHTKFSHFNVAYWPRR